MAHPLPHSGLLGLLHDRKSEIEALARRYGARRVRVFGSVARGEESENSDIDFLVSFPPGYDLFRQRLPLGEALQKLLSRPVELIPEHELSPHIRAHVLEEAIEL